MESNINYNPTIMRDISGKVIETKRQNSAKSVINKLLRVDLMDSIKEMDSNKEARSTAVTSPTQSAKTEFPPKPYPSASDKYLQQEEKIRRMENAARTKSTVYRPLDNEVKGGFERALEKMHQLGKTKAKLTEKSAKMAVSFEKILEFLKKYNKSIKA